MKRMLFNATQAEELRVAIVDGQKLIDLDIETVGKEQRKGNIYKGVITRIEPSLEACFVDYGTERHGFLPFKEVSRSYFQGYEGGRPRIQDVLREGMEVVVQVEKDERGNKGAALTTYISLAGRYLVLMPNNPRGGGVSRRIEGEERQELKELLSQLEVPGGMSMIARTAGIGRGLEELQWDLGYLMQLWRAIEGAASAQNAPFLILQEGSLVIRAIRDYYHPDIGEVLIDTEEIYQQARQFMSHVMPNMVHRVKLYTDPVPLFSRFQIEHQIETAFSRSVQLPSGGAIVIDHTEALVSIDVNSARSTKGADIEETALRTNLEAAEEIARQLRLRDLGGLIVIDFIDMENPKNQREVENKLREVLKHDRARVQMGKLSRFGLLELSRQRLQPSLGETSHEPCPRCHGIGFIRGTESSALHILRILQEEAMKENTGAVNAQVPVDVATFLLNEKRAEIYAIEERLNVDVVLIPNIHLETPHYRIVRVRHDDLAEMGDEPSYLRVEVQEEDLAAQAGREKPKLERQEAAVKGITPQQPAPTSSSSSSAEKSAGLFAGVVSWFKSLFAAPEPEVKPAAKKAPVRDNNNRNRQRNNDRRPGSQARREREEKRHQGTSAPDDKRRQDSGKAELVDKQEKSNLGQREGRAERAERTDRQESTGRSERGERKERREREPRENRENSAVGLSAKPVVAQDERAEKPSHQESRRKPVVEKEDQSARLADEARDGIDIAGENGEVAEKGDRRRRRGRRERRRDGSEATAEVSTSAMENVAPVVAGVAAIAVVETAGNVIQPVTAAVVTQAEVPAAPVQPAPVVELPKVEAVQTIAAVAEPEVVTEVAAPVAIEPARFQVVETQVAQPAPVAGAPVIEEVVTRPVVEVAQVEAAVSTVVEPVMVEVRTKLEEQPEVASTVVVAEPAIDVVAVVADVASYDEPAATPVAVTEAPVESVVEPVAAAAPVIAAPVDLGGLVMVSTKVESREVVAETVEVVQGLRRRDRTQEGAADTVVGAALVQIETVKRD